MAGEAGPGFTSDLRIIMIGHLEHIRSLRYKPFGKRHEDQFAYRQETVSFSILIEYCYPWRFVTVSIPSQPYLTTIGVLPI